MEFGTEQMTLGTELLRVLAAGDVTRLKDLLRSEGRSGADGHVAIEVNGASPAAASPPVGTGCLLGVTSNGNTALHLVASRGHAELAALVCERVPSLVATRNAGLDTPLHCAAKAGSRAVSACLLSQMRAAGEADAAAALRARNLLGATALHEAVRLSRAAKQEHDMLRNGAIGSVTNDDGISPLYLAAITPSRFMVRLLLRPSPDGTPSPASFEGRSGRTALHVAAATSKDKDSESGDKEESDEEGYMMGNGTIASGLIAIVAFAAAVTVPGGFISDDNPHPGTAILAKRFAFRAFVVSDTMAFLSSIIATCFLIYGGAREVPPRHRETYKLLASGLVPLAVQFMIAAFAFGFHLVLGAANLGLIIFVYMVSSASVLFCFPGIWVPFCLGFQKAIWRRAGWRGILNLPKRPSGLLHVVCHLCYSPLIQVRRTVCAVLICVTFVVAIALEIALPNY
ncbi:hypothetical protein HU200_034384 [Digitaria exilis]|uniref:PGG domain-containing protein n=1 Tax=Digitaria exilis TaxID=1010633 RepID=A0A835BKZ6_9POAL|nr:hypothetical protein HU200_034384 [Digitaria exilis]